MKILHSADWHLDSPLVGRTEEQARYLREELLKIPEKVAACCNNEGCDLLLLAGDLFDAKDLGGNFLLAKAIEKLSDERYIGIIQTTWASTTEENSIVLLSFPAF